jgi:hypothetical protein
MGITPTEYRNRDVTRCCWFSWNRFLNAKQHWYIHRSNIKCKTL